MRPNDDIDFTTLTWVKGELDETLKQAQQALEAYVEDPNDASQMRFCATYLHQVQGTLRMVELYGAAMVTEEMEQLASALLDSHVPERDEAYAVLMRGIVQLPDYLERLQSGHKDIPIVLLPLLNDLRAARGEKGLSEIVLFTPDLGRALPASAQGPAAPLPEQELRRFATALRGHFQVALLKWFKNDEVDSNVARLTDVCDKLVSLTTQEEARRLFWVAASVLDALRAKAFEPSPQLKQTIGKVEREIKRLADAGENSFRVDPPRELTRNLLYFVAHAPTEHGRIGELREVFNLNALLPSEDEIEHARGSMSGHNRALLDTVSIAIKDDLMRVKDALDLYLRTQNAQPADLSSQVEVLDRVSDTLGMLGLGVARRVVVEQRDAVHQVASGHRPADESSLLDIAGALLYVEATLDDQVQHLGSIGSSASDSAPPMQMAENRRVLEAVVKEAQNNFAAAKQAFVAFIESNWDHNQLDAVPTLMGEVAGAMRIVELPRPAQYLDAVKVFTQVELLSRRRVPAGTQMETLADVLASLEYFLEALGEHRAGREKILDVAERSLESLGYWPVPVQAVAPTVSEQADVDARVAAAIAASEDAYATEEPLIFAETPLPPPRLAPVAPPAVVEVVAAPQIVAPVAAVAAPTPVAAEPLAPLQGFEGASDEIDDEIRDVFIEEVQEEIANLEDLLPTWKSDPANLDHLKSIRRVFHTLKGSGRLVGALTLGEFSWKIESMLNRVLDHSIQPTPAVTGLVDHAFNALPDLLAALRGQGAAHADLEAIKAIADRVAAGEQVFYEPRPTRAGPALDVVQPGSGRIDAEPIEVEQIDVEPLAVEQIDAASFDSTPAVLAQTAMPDVLDTTSADEVLSPADETVIALDDAELFAEADAAPDPFDAIDIAPEIEPAAGAASIAVPTIDPVLFDILKAEVAGHLDTVDAYLADSQFTPQRVPDVLLRAVHTMNGAFAMTDVPVITDVLGPLEGYFKRLLAHGLVPNANGRAALVDTAAAVRALMLELERPQPRLSDLGTLAERITLERDALPEAGGPSSNTLMPDPVDTFEPVTAADNAELTEAVSMASLQDRPTLDEFDVDALEARLDSLLPESDVVDTLDIDAGPVVTAADALAELAPEEDAALAQAVQAETEENNAAESDLLAAELLQFEDVSEDVSAAAQEALQDRISLDTTADIAGSGVAEQDVPVDQLYAGDYSLSETRITLDDFDIDSIGADVRAIDAAPVAGHVADAAELDITQTHVSPSDGDAIELDALALDALDSEAIEFDPSELDVSELDALDIDSPRSDAADRDGAADTSVAPAASADAEVALEWFDTPAAIDADNTAAADSAHASAPSASDTGEELTAASAAFAAQPNEDLGDLASIDAFDAVVAQADTRETADVDAELDAELLAFDSDTSADADLHFEMVETEFDGAQPETAADTSPVSTTDESELVAGGLEVAPSLSFDSLEDAASLAPADAASGLTMDALALADALDEQAASQQNASEHIALEEAEFAQADASAQWTDVLAPVVTTDASEPTDALAEDAFDDLEISFEPIDAPSADVSDSVSVSESLDDVAAADATAAGDARDDTLLTFDEPVADTLAIADSIAQHSLIDAVGGGALTESTPADEAAIASGEWSDVIDVSATPLDDALVEASQTLAADTNLDALEFPERVSSDEISAEIDAFWRDLESADLESVDLQGTEPLPAASPGADPGAPSLESLEEDWAADTQTPVAEKSVTAEAGIDAPMSLDDYDWDALERETRPDAISALTDNAATIVDDASATTADAVQTADELDHADLAREELAGEFGVPADAPAVDLDGEATAASDVTASDDATAFGVDPAASTVDGSVDIHAAAPLATVDDEDFIFADDADEDAPAAPPASVSIAPVPVPAPRPDPRDLAAAAAFLAGLDDADPDPDAPLELADMDEELLDIFLEEGGDLLDHSDALMAKLRDTPEDRESVIGLQRDLHTLKGGARMAGLVPVGDLSHAMESLLEAVAEGRRELPRHGVELLQRAFDRLHSMVTRVGERRALASPTLLIERVEALVLGQMPELPNAAEFLAANEAEEIAASAPAETLTSTGGKRPAPVSAPIVELLGDDDDIAARLPQEQIRIRADLLDRLVNYAGEVAIYRARLEQQLGLFRGNLSELEQTTLRLREQLRKLEIETEAQIASRYQREAEVSNDPSFDPLELDRFSTLQQLSRALSESAADIVNLQGSLDDHTRQYETLLLQQSRVSSDLQEGLMRTRMVPFDSLVPRLRRIIRQTGTELGKKAQLKVDGAQGEMDRNVLERMTAPLEHMLRNSLAHGLELPEERIAAGKPEEGSVRVHVLREGSEVVIKVSDDGRGLDGDAIRRKAISRGLLAEDVQVSDRDLYAFILEAGFSTAESVSKIAGRGVGMDVVHSEIRQLGGTLQIDSVRGRGTDFTIRLPFTLAVTQAVFVKQGETSFAVPIASVQGVARIDRAELEAKLAAGDAKFVYAGEDYLIHDMGLLLGDAPAKAEGSLQVPLLLARSGDQRAAICVDQVIGSREIVVKPVGPQVGSIPGIFGATIMGDGRVIVILDVAPLVRRHIAQRRPDEPRVVVEPVETRRIPLVMVVDDSITMRKVTSRVLERHSYEVLTAKDGVDAIEKLADRVPDVMLLDIEMPRMDGYELATHMRNDVRLRGVPIIMITSRTGEKHRQRAFEIGVDRYLGKPYQEAELMRNVQEILRVGRGELA